MPRHCFSTALGTCSLQWDGALLTHFELPAARAQLDDVMELPPFVVTLIDQVRRHLQGEAQDFSTAPIAWDLVPEFQRQVLQMTLRIKSGQTLTYGEIAARIGQPPAASRAVGTALGANPWPLIVPCHRVVAADGRMTGFSGPGGISTKLKLLALEGNQLFSA